VLESEVALVHWLTRVVELNNRLEAENIIKKFETLEKSHSEFKKKMTQEVKELTHDLNIAKTEKDETLAKMKQLNEKVVKPLIG